MTHRTALPFLVLAAALAASPALAHTGVGATHGALEGFAHPFSGADHFLAMVGVGLIGALVGGRGLLLPAGFVAGLVVGALLGFTGIAVPGVEGMIAGSVVLIGLALARGRALDPVALGIGAAAFGLVHGVAHGLEAPADGSGSLYLAGIVAATTLLHGLGWSAMRIVPAAASGRIATVAGLGLAVAGVAISIA